MGSRVVSENPTTSFLFFAVAVAVYGGILFVTMAGAFYHLWLNTISQSSHISFDDSLLCRPRIRSGNDRFQTAVK
ncbi:hypothetical protein SUGI_0623480 [Cryptomeria japonica]|nr:hypothetical protein SUGI_0623480 [Cryptomeria japonica]